MKKLKEVREKWEKGLTVKCVLDLDDKEVVILQDGDTYCIHRYFILGGGWACSIDKSNASLDDVFFALEYIIL